MPISVETLEPQTPVVSQAGEPPVVGPPALAVAARALQEPDHRQPPSNVDSRAEGRVALPETFRAAARVARAVAAPVTSVAAAHAVVRLAAAHPAVVHPAVVHPAAAQRAAVAHVAAVAVTVVAVMAVAVMAEAVMAEAVMAEVENKYII